MNETEREYKKVHFQFRLALTAAFFILGFGSIFYHIIEKLNWVDALYFSTVTLTTVGYGDITPHTRIGKLFTVGYIIVGIGILATLANLLVKNAVLRRKSKRSRNN